MGRELSNEEARALGLPVTEPEPEPEPEPRRGKMGERPTQGPRAGATIVEPSLLRQEAMGPSRPLPRSTSFAGAALKGVQDLPTFGFGDELGGALQAGLLKLPPAVQQMLGGSGYAAPESFGQNYRAARDELRGESGRAAAQHPWAYYGAGTVASLPLNIGAARLMQPVAEGAPLLARMLAGAKAGAAQGAFAGAGTSEGATLEDVAWDSAKGMGVGAGLGGALPAAARGVGAALSPLARGVVTPTAEATALRARGVPLTIGQMQPGGVLGQLEEASQSVSGAGPIIEGQRAAARQAWQNAALGEGVAPGGTIPIAGTPQEKLSHLYEGFNAAYEDVRSSPPSARAATRPSTADTLRRALGKAVEDPSALATDADKVAVGRFLEDQASIVSKKGAAGLTPEELLTIRSNIRAQMAKLEAGDAKRQLLENAEEAVTNRLAYSLPKATLSQLRAADAQYGRYKVLEKAARAAGDRPEGFTPTQLGAAVRSATDAGAYARGAGGPLRELAAAGREVFDVRTPPTGARLLAAGPAKYVTAPLSALANTRSVQPLLLGETAAQMRARALVDALRGGAQGLGLAPGGALAGSTHSLPGLLGMTALRRPRVLDDELLTRGGL